MTAAVLDRPIADTTDRLIRIAGIPALGIPSRVPATDLVNLGNGTRGYVFAVV